MGCWWKISTKYLKESVKRMIICTNLLIENKSTLIDEELCKSEGFHQLKNPLKSNWSKESNYQVFYELIMKIILKSCEKFNENEKKMDKKNLENNLQ